MCTTICPYFINTGMFDGATTGFLFPLLEQQPTIDRMVAAILQNEEEVTIPWVTGILTHLVKALFPSSVQDWIAYTLAGNNHMDTFKGRQGAQAPL